MSVRRAGAAILLALSLSVPAAAAPPAQVRIGAPVPLPPGTRPLAAVAASRPLRMTVVLRPRNPAALAAYASAVAVPGSPVFRRYLRPEAFARRFGAAPGAAAAVAASLRAHGLQPGRVTPNGLSIPVRGTVGGAERAFSVSLGEVRLPSGAAAVVASAAPALDASVAGQVQAVLGLSSLVRPRPLDLRAGISAQGRTPRSRAHVATGGPQPCSAASSSAPAQQAYTADQIASAYGFSGLYRAGDGGQGQTVALYELEPVDPRDIAAYQACYGTHSAVSYVPVDGGAGTGAGSGEAALDIEQVIGLAPRAHLVVYEGPNSSSDSAGSGPYDTDSAIVTQDLASVVSTSWGQCEPVEGQTDAAAEGDLFEEAAIQGQTVISASGDSGAEDCDQSPPSVPDPEIAVDDPASQPFVTGAGGTSMPALGPPPAESAWNNGGNPTGLVGIQPGAGGGGISAFWAMPAYQSRAPAALRVRQSLSSRAPCHSASVPCREVPDVSADADPRTGYLIYYNGSGQETGSPQGWQGTGGTSAAAPLWAAVVALADAAPACGGARLGFLNPVLYRLAAASPGRYLHDITTGNNDYTGTSGGRYPAGTGYDMATGLGSPDAAMLASGLCRAGLRLSAPGPRLALRGMRTGVRLLASDAAGAGLAVRASGLPPGLRLDRARLLVSGRPLRVGHYEVTVVAADAAGAVRSVTFPWTIAGRPTVSGASLSGRGSARPRLRLTLSSGRFEPSLTRIGLLLPAGFALARASRVSASGPTGGLPARVSGRGRHVSVTLVKAAGRLRLTLAPGSLTHSGRLVAAGGGLLLAVTSTDSGHATARLLVWLPAEG
jgi:hypothetical protein